MNTDALIAKLSADLVSVPDGAARASVLKALGVGASISCLFVLLEPSLGLRPDLGSALQTGLFWVKVCYTASMAVLGLLALEHLSRPESDRVHWVRLLWPPMVLLCAVTAARSALSPAVSNTVFWFGSSWWECPLYVIALSVPVVVALIFAVSRLAPTRLALAGGAAGLVAGATGATVYALHCVETSPAFVLVWYSLGLAATSAAGALLGRRTLRW
jgi:hypothetical protein